YVHPRSSPPFPTRRSSDLPPGGTAPRLSGSTPEVRHHVGYGGNSHTENLRTVAVVPDSLGAQVTRFAIRSLVAVASGVMAAGFRSEEHTSELQSRENLVCR